MKRFSGKAFIIVALLHIAGTLFLLDAAISRMKAYEHGDTSLSLTIVSWVWEPVPMVLSHYIRFSPAGYFYHLALPWSVCVGGCLAFLVPRLSRWTHQMA